MTIVVEKKIACRAKPHALWCIITDTERLNRAIGLGRIDMTANDDETAARYIVDTVSGGFPLTYEERPYEWIENERFRIRRDVRKGAVKTIDNFFGLEPRQDGGTDLTVRISIEPRYAALSPFVHLQTRKFVKRVVKEIENIDASLAAGKAAELPDKRQRLHEAELDKASERLRRRAPEKQRRAAEKLSEALRREPDTALDRMRPFELAARWDLDERTVLGACLNAVESGLLELRWDLICPSCRTASDRLSSLADMSEEGHCQLCDITFDLSLDRAVEATFRPAAGVRELDAGPYCSGGPARTPHVTAQAILPADGELVMYAPTAEGNYRVFVRGGAHAALNVREVGVSQVEIDVSDVNEDMGQLDVQPGAEITLRQRRGARERHVKIERLGWKSHAATAAVVSTLPDFRRIFSSDVLRVGTSLKVGRVSLMFTDLTASTQLYRDVGDASAFKIVQDHFELLGELIEVGRGAIVKTMGDAVMAVFTSEADAVSCAKTIHEAFPAFRDAHSEAGACYVKIGVYTGPCYAVTANGILDYFGQAVNVAARLQAQAGGGELVMTEEAWKETGHELLGDLPIDRFSASLKGVGDVDAVRLRLDDAPDEAGRAAG